MSRAAVVYATREGQTEKIAWRVAATLRARGVGVDVFRLDRHGTGVNLSGYTTAILAASVHIGRHEPEMIAFVKANRRDLDRLSAAFLSVSLSEVGAEDRARPADRREQFAADVRMMLETFAKDTGWRPSRVKAVAGALMYSRYNFLVRLAIKLIARKAGAPTDASRDYEFTDWADLDAFIVRVAEADASRETAPGAANRSGDAAVSAETTRPETARSA